MTLKARTTLNKKLNQYKIIKSLHLEVAPALQGRTPSLNIWSPPMVL